MALTLTSRDVDRFVAMQRTLLAPLDYACVEDWSRDVLHRVETLFDGDRSAMLVPLSDGTLHYTSENIDPKLLAAFKETIARTEPGALRFSRQLEDRAWEVRRAEHLDVWSIPTLARRIGIRLEDWPTYHEHAKPAGITHGPVMTTAVQNGEAFVGVANSRPASARFNERSSLALMRMLLPSFQAGVNLFVRLHEVRAAFGQTIDALGDPLSVFDLSGCCLHQTPSFIAILSRDSEHDALRQQIQNIAGEHIGVRSSRCLAHAEPRGVRNIQTSTATYRVHSCWAGGLLLGRDDILLLRIERLTPILPSLTDLIASYSLTPREAQVAVLLAQGFSNRAISAQLTLSPHTVRHHAEWVFNKLGVHTRKALALVLLKQPVTESSP